MSMGLTSAEVDELTRQGQTNKTMTRSSMSVAHIVASNVFTYFNAIFALLAVLVVMAGEYKHLTFLPVVIANMVIGIVQQLRSKKVLDDLALLDVCSYTCLRDDEERTIDSSDLVLGDVIHLESGQQVPADAVVVEGEAGLNEALLTGESDEVEKRPGDELMSGSFVATGAVLARLTRVGEQSYASQLTAKAKTAKRHKSEMVRDIETIILVAGIAIIPVGALLYWQGVQNGMSFSDAIVSMVGAVTGMIPEGLYLLVTIALALSAMRLAKSWVLLHDMRSIETLARVDVLCVDKTGTITSENMAVQEVFPAPGQLADDFIGAQELLGRYMWTVNDNNATMIALRLRFGELEPLPAVEVVPFSSKLKYSQVRCAQVSYRLGAPEFLLSGSNQNACMPLVQKRAEEGMRVLALVEELEAGWSPLLFVALRNEVRPDARATFSYFAGQGVRVVVISGDNPLTVSRVALDAGIVGADRYVDASTLASKDALRTAVRECNVFGRVKPEQKRELVEALKAQGLKVAMTGDGVNDILAMKEADCSIAMGGGSDAARQAAQVVLLDSDFSHMSEIVGEGRRNINNITRSATLFLYKNIFSLSLALYIIIGSYAYPLTPNQVSLVSLFNVGLPAFLLAFEPNERKQEGRFLWEVILKSLPAGLTSFIAIALLVRFAGFFGVSQAEVATSSTYLLAVVGFLILLGLIHPPNRYRLMVLAICIVGFVAACCLFWRLFDIQNLQLRAWLLCGVFAVAEAAALLLLSKMRDWLQRRYGVVSAGHMAK